eukprot:gnl/MRDRNA2_/MRDRNA2_256524_c0_seq1.p1 gnl/MRDRNA2_/MRDRNA2_256524_c0~~gnl/MRDRNA2_/MRDRNA2_256524_c0_seq1.p1  ORF type:complete len:139 (-),score=9.57 gnl/MRDRNA2_/MRDRNA2_256524_c0_seq1:200-616(-)
MHVEYLSAWGAAMLMCSLIMSIALYFGLILSPSGEDDSGKALLVFMRFAAPLLVLSICCFISGVCVFYVAHSRFLIATSPFQKFSTKTANDTLTFTVLPILVFTILISMAGVACSCRTRHEKMTDIEANESGAPQSSG